MTDILHAIRKPGKQLLFEVQLNWLVKKRGILSASDTNSTLHVATPKKFGGEGKDWGPEHLFLGSISSSFMTTYLFFAQKLGFEISGLECEAIGQIEIVDGGYQFTRINVFPKIYVADDAVKESATLALQNTKKYCLVSNSIKSAIIYHGEIFTDLHPAVKQIKS